MRKINIILHKDRIYKKIEAITWKRMDASLGGETERTQSATSADTDSEKVDALLVDDYCQIRDAIIRARLKFCLINETGDELTFDNNEETPETYEYVMNLDDTIGKNDVQSIGTLLESYIIRGATFDWYRKMGLEPMDNDASLTELEESIVSIVRGKCWGAKPLQPFGPGKFDFNKVF